MLHQFHLFNDPMVFLFLQIKVIFDQLLISIYFRLNANLPILYLIELEIIIKDRLQVFLQNSWFLRRYRLNIVLSPDHCYFDVFLRKWDTFGGVLIRHRTGLIEDSDLSSRSKGLVSFRGFLAPLACPDCGIEVNLRCDELLAVFDFEFFLDSLLSICQEFFSVMIVP